METYKVIGLMSGTSLDGLDIAYCHYHFNGEKWQFEIVKTRQIAYTHQWLQRLKEAIYLSAIDLLVLHHDYGKWLGEQVKEFINQEKITVDFVASHGHTVHHQPELGVTYQVGCGQHLSNICGANVICDFRSGDLALGGQGAPLVPVGDRYLFGEYDFCLNLGGISNISFEEKNQRIAYDIGIANMLLNFLSQKAGKSFDENGNMARAGKCNPDLLMKLNNLTYYKESYPKSTGYEWFAREVRPLVDTAEISTNDLLCTAVHHIAQSISLAVKKHSVERVFPRMLVTGGGAFNGYLLAIMRENLENKVEIIVPEKEVIDFKEALVFGYLGVLRKRRENNIFRSVTGASADSCGGIFYFPQ